MMTVEKISDIPKCNRFFNTRNHTQHKQDIDNIFTNGVLRKIEL